MFNFFKSMLVALTIKVLGSTSTINSQSVSVLVRDSIGNVLVGTFTAVITAGGAGYAKGAIMLDTSTGKWAQNEGTTASCSFNIIGDVSSSDLSNGSVTAEKLATNAVEEIKINTGAVTQAKIAIPKLVFAQETCGVASFTDGGGAVGTLETSIVIPEGAVVVQAFLDTVVGFGGDTSAVITIGDGTDVDRYNTGTPDVFATADHVSAGLPSGTVYHAESKAVTLTVTSATDFGLVATDEKGSVGLTIAYYQSI